MALALTPRPQIDTGRSTGTPANGTWSCIDGDTHRGSSLFDLSIAEDLIADLTARLPQPVVDESDWTRLISGDSTAMKTVTAAPEVIRLRETSLAAA